MDFASHARMGSRSSLCTRQSMTLHYVFLIFLLLCFGVSGSNASPSLTAREICVSPVYITFDVCEKSMAPERTAEKTAAGHQTLSGIIHSAPFQPVVQSVSSASLPPSSPFASTPSSVSSASSPSSASSASSESSTFASPISSQPSAAETSSSAPEASSAALDDDLSGSKFLSFEEWKAQMLVKAGLTADEIRRQQDRASAEAAAASQNRARPIGGADQSLDDLGGELELNFNFFGTPTVADSSVGDEVDTDTSEQHVGKSAPSSEVVPTDTKSRRGGRLKNKNKTNYASFDCASTIIKTNSEMRGASSILVENKDSYMLNPCNAPNKFVIIELCQAILIHTIAIANYEFFSSMVREFRVSVSERYPVKASGWKVIGRFEAANVREVQNFEIEIPQIFAKFLRIEFLSHWGQEFYCPLSVVRVHGITEMEEYKYQEELYRADDERDENDKQEEVDEDEEDEADMPQQQQQTNNQQEEPKQQQQQQQQVQQHQHQQQQSQHEQPNQQHHESHQYITQEPKQLHPLKPLQPSEQEQQVGLAADVDSVEIVPVEVATKVSVDSSICSPFKEIYTRRYLLEVCDRVHDAPSGVFRWEAGDSYQIDLTGVKPVSVLAQVREKSTDSSAMKNLIESLEVTSDHAADEVLLDHFNLESGRSTVSATHSPTYSAPMPNPTTQESVYKTIMKRLTLLEANATLSLQYIEEQSLMFRDAFTKIEKRQGAKLMDMLDQLNSTVSMQMQSFRENYAEQKQQYEQLWKAMITEYEMQRRAMERHLLEAVIFMFCMVLLCVGFNIYLVMKLKIKVI
ncbi:UNC-like C-terminal-domain-containing protein [Myxozyma melibiosi]|uniref:UNC-like C-terminal-domain-containing protein n=1 Tax=Myxozyma melibiosi TaxID=54550 RepID=A0ABR1FD41_9ASCO